MSVSKHRPEKRTKKNNTLICKFIEVFKKYETLTLRSLPYLSHVHTHTQIHTRPADLAVKIT